MPALQALQKRLSILEQRTVPSLERALESNRASVNSKVSPVRQICHTQMCILNGESNPFEGLLQVEQSMRAVSWLLRHHSSMPGFPEGRQ